MTKPIIPAAFKAAFTAASTTLAALSFAASAAASSGTVRFADLNLNSIEGQAELAKRIDIAASHICTITRETGTILRKSAPSKACINDARAQISEQVQKLAARNLAASEQLARK